MRCLLIATIFVLSNFSAHAEGLLSKKDIQEIVADMVQAYKLDNKNSMKVAEGEYWKGLTDKKFLSAAQAGLAYCGVAGMAGHMIESYEAEKNGKKISAYWTDDAVSTRMANYATKMKISESLFEETMDTEISGNAENIAKALIKQGFMLD